MSSILRFALIPAALLTCQGTNLLAFQRPSETYGAESGSHSAAVCEFLPMSNAKACAADILKQQLEAVGQKEREVKIRQEVHRRELKIKFNQLVDAIHDFAKQFNSGDGSVWPQREADQLRQAMRQLQSFEKSLRESPGRQRQRRSLE